MAGLVKIRKARNEHMFSALVPIARVCRGNIAANAIAMAVPSVRLAVVAFPEFPISLTLRLCCGVAPMSHRIIHYALGKMLSKFVGSAWCQGEIKQLDYGGFGESPLLVKAVASLP
jgi:hypothetical protein